MALHQASPGAERDEPKEEATEEGTESESGDEDDADVQVPGGQQLPGVLPAPALDPDLMLELALLSLADQRVRVRKLLPRGFYISEDHVTARRTLHSLACYRTPGVDFEPWHYVGIEAPAEECYDRICRSCFGEVTTSALAQPSEEACRSDDDFTSDSSDDDADESSLDGARSGLAATG